jgi:adenine-specific DNA-methyltransferase
LWEYGDVGHTQEAKKELLAYVPFERTENVLNTVKPPRLIQRMLHVATDPRDGDLVLDFFSGSAATAHAVLAQNREDDGNRRFIMVQFPEPLPKSEPTLETIADIGTERVRRVVAQMGAEDEGKLDLHPDEDLGFRVFKLAPSHIRSWTGIEEATPEEYAGQMALFADPLVDGWKAEHVIYEIAFKEGYGLNCDIMPLDDTSATYRVTDPDKEQSFSICLGDELPPDIIRTLGLTKDDLFVCRDIALTDDLAANLALQCRLKTI